MVNIMRSNQRWLMIVVSLLAVISLFYWSNTNTTRGDHGGIDKVGQLYGKSLTLPDLERTVRQLKTAQELGLTNLIQRELFENGNPNASALDHLVVLHEAEAMGIIPSESEVEEAEKNLPVFQGAGGGFDRSKYDQFVAGDSLSPRGFSANLIDDLVKRDLQFARLREIVEAPVVVSPVELRRVYEQHYAKTDASVIRFQKADFVATTAEPSEEDIKKYFDEHKDTLQQPEKRKVQYVKFALTEDEKKLTGKPRMDALTVQRDKSVDFLAQAMEQKGKQEFAALAAAAKLEVKETPEFAQDQTEGLAETSIPQFVESAFALTKENPDSNDPLTAPDAYYDLHLLAVTPQRPLTLDEAKPKIVAAIKDERATATLTAKADEVRAKLADALKAGKSFADAAKEAGQTVQDVPPFSMAEPARAVPDAQAVVEAAQDLGSGELSKVIPSGTGGLLVYVRGREGIDESKFDKQKAMIGASLQRGKGGLYFYEWLLSRKEAANAQLDPRLQRQG